MSPSSSPVPTPKRIVGTPRSATPSSTVRVAGRAKRAYSSGESDPAQLSKSCTAWAPAVTWSRSEATAMAANRSVSCAHSSRCTVHQRLDLGKGARRASFDDVAGHREGCPGEADQRDPRPGELLRHQAHRVADVGGVGTGFERSEAGEVGLAAERLGHHRAAARLHLDAETDGVQGHDDVREEDGGVHAVATHRLQRQLGGQGSVADGRQDGAFAPRRPVLGEGPSGLAHEPHGRAGHRLEQAGAHEVRAGICRRVHPRGSMTTAVP